MYIFTNDTASQILLAQECPGLGYEAQEVRRRLEKKYKMPVVAWCQMGGDNPRVSFIANVAKAKAK